MRQRREVAHLFYLKLMNIGYDLLLLFFSFSVCECVVIFFIIPFSLVCVCLFVVVVVNRLVSHVHLFGYDKCATEFLSDKLYLNDTIYHN